MARVTTVARATAVVAAVSRERYRDAMARLPAAVNIVTTDGPAGRAGLTASAVCSLTDEPPALIVCVNRTARAHHAARENGHLAVNVLHDGARELSAVFAGKGGLDMAERFRAGGHWTVLNTGSPVLEDAICAFDCEIEAVHEVGTHAVLFCRVVSVREATPGPNLLYHERQYKSCPMTA